MAESKNNIITHGLSGKVGNMLVFSQRNGKTIVSQAPKKSAEDSDKQKAHKEKFQKAVLYAKSALQDATLKGQYQEIANKRHLSAYNIAVADLLNAPKIEQIDLSAYHGQVGDVIKVRAYDDFKVVSVSVHIYNSDGVLVEEGNATEQGIDWVYTATTQNTDLSGDKIIVRATDTPHNVSEKEQVI